MKLPDFPHGTRVTTAVLNKLARQANVGAGIRAGKGLTWRNMAGGPQLSLAAQQLLDSEPATAVMCVNTGTDDIEAYAPAGIIESLGKLDGEMQAQRCLSVRLPKARDAGDIVITAQRIPAGGAGWAWSSGVCLVRLLRWFQAELLDKADILAGQRYALASIDGPLDVVWSQRYDAAGSLIVNQEHWAVVRFNGRRQLRWKNTGTVDVPFGGPICLLKSQTDGLVGGVLSARAPNSSDTLTTSFINLGGTVKAGEFGKCTAGVALARCKAAYNSLATVGAEQGQSGISSSGLGWTLIARMGPSPVDALQYAVVAPAGGSSPLYTLQIIGGNTLSDGFTAGIKWAGSAPTSVPSLYDPNVDTSFIDGIGRAFLFNGTTSTKVLVAHFSGNGGPYTQALVANQLPVTDGRTVTLPWVTDPTQSVSLIVPAAP